MGPQGPLGGGGYVNYPDRGDGDGTEGMPTAKLTQLNGHYVHVF